MSWGAQQALLTWAAVLVLVVGVYGWRLAALIWLVALGLSAGALLLCYAAGVITRKWRGRGRA
jgi:hypothetical protein